MSVSLDADIAATMTPEELAAINESEYSEDELATMKGIAGAGDGEGNDDDDEAGGDDDGKVGNAVPAATAASAQDPAPAPAVAAGTDDEDADIVEFRPVYRAELPADFADRKASLESRETQAEQDFRDGKTDFDEYKSAMREIAKERDELVSVQTKAEISAEMSSQTIEQQWANTVATFVASTAKAGGIDYAKDEAKRDDLDGFVKALANKQENADKPMRWFLAEADKRVRALHGVAVQASAPARREDPPAAPKAGPRKPDLANAPKTLAQVPGGDGPGDVAGEFAAIDALDGMDLEDAIAKMTPAQRERYLRAA